MTKKVPKRAPRHPKTEVLHEKMKTVLCQTTLKKKIPTPNLTSNFEPIGMFKGGWFFYFSVITYVLLPSSLMDDFTVFFFPRDFQQKKKPSTKLELNPKVEKNLNLFGNKSRLFASRFFFRAKSRGKKKYRKIISFLPIFSLNRQFCM